MKKKLDFKAKKMKLKFFTEIDNCPYCGTELEKHDYSSISNPAELLEYCPNYKCRKYENAYYYFTGNYYKCGNWIYDESKDSEKMDAVVAFKEFGKRVRYQTRKGANLAIKMERNEILEFFYAECKKNGLCVSPRMIPKFKDVFEADMWIKKRVDPRYME